MPYVFLLLAAELLAAELTVTPGAVNEVVLESGGRRLAVYAASKPVERILYTHHRRDALRVIPDTPAVIPAAEEKYFKEVEQFWQDYRKARFHDYQVQTTKVLPASIAGAKAVKGGDIIEFQGKRIEVIDTPGYTAGAVTYLLEADGKRVAFTGDLIYGDGQLLDIYSLQNAVPNTNVRGYHGYAARAADLIASLRKVLAKNPDVLIPARGPLIERPREAAEKLIGRLQRVFLHYFATDALLWYWGEENQRSRAKGIVEDRLAEMPRAALSGPREPPWLLRYRTSRVIVSETGGAVLIDCGYRDVIAEMKRWIAAGRIRKIESIYVTHYHDDHTDWVQAAADEFQVPVLYATELHDIYANPGAYKMPALTSAPIRRGEPLNDGATRRWHEFDLTSFFFPGQTLYHGALLAKKGKRQVLIAGDSFTPSGMDDYCLWNRNLLGDGEGYFYCLRKLDELGAATEIVNMHVDQTFRFTKEQVGVMRASLTARRQAIAELTPFDSPNYAVDEQWARFYPFAAEGRAGEERNIGIFIRNHSPVARAFTATLRLPPGWKATRLWETVQIPAGREGEMKFRVTPSGTGVLTADIEFGDWKLSQWCELLFDATSLP